MGEKGWRANKKDDNWSTFFKNDNVVHTDFDIQVPASAMLDVYGFSSDVDIKGITGTQKLETFSGKITVTGAKAGMTVETFSGGERRRLEIAILSCGASIGVNCRTRGSAKRPA